MEVRTGFKYFIPTILSVIFIVLSELGRFYLIFPVLLAANFANILWGEFTAAEIRKELKLFYSNRTVILVKRISAVCLLSMLAWSISFIDRTNPTWTYMIVFALCTGCLTGCFIVTLAHDLLHSSHKTDIILSSIMLSASCIPHMAADHVCGHHRQVGLKNDANTSKVNQDFYSYFAILSFHRFKNSFFTQFGLPSYFRKKILRLNIKMLVLFTSMLIMIYFFTSNPALTLSFFVIQGFVAYFLYELINYIQHYGLSRVDEDQKITMNLSWNCYYKYTNYILHLLPLHSLHHLPANSRKLKDESLKDGPRMPYLYFVMVLMALVPPLWFYKMNKLASEVNARYTI